MFISEQAVCFFAWYVHNALSMGRNLRKYFCVKPYREQHISPDGGNARGTSESKEKLGATLDVFLL